MKTLDNTIDNASIDEMNIQNMVHEIRGQQVMLDRNLAQLYGVETKALNQAVRRNIERFPEDFMFELSPNEYNLPIDSSRSQIVTLNKTRGQNIKYAPLAFTEQGVAMLSSVLRSKAAVDINISIMRAFVAARKLAEQFNTVKAEREIEVNDDKKQLLNTLEDNMKTHNNTITNASIDEMNIQNMVHEIRGQQVMLDRDLAKLYGVVTRDLNKAVRRNIERFPEDFMFQLTKTETENLMFQSGTSSWGGTRKLPLAFTEQGVAMLSSVLRSKAAVDINIKLLKAFDRSSETSDFQDNSKQLLPSIILMNGFQAVSALEMYIALGLSTSHWQRWYKKNIINNEFFAQDVDYQIFRHKGENPLVGRPTQDFMISLDMAKHLAMMARTKRSHELRQYFIETEKKHQAEQFNTVKAEREIEVNDDKKYLLNAFATLEPDLEDYSNTILTLNFVTTRECFLKTILPLVKLYGGKYRGTPGYMFTQYEQAEEAQREINTKCFNYEIPIKSFNNTSRYALKQLGLYENYKKIFNLKEKLYA